MLGRHTCKVAGAVYDDRQRVIAIMKASIEKNPNCAQVTIEPEPSNEYDPNAYVVRWYGRPIGYIPRAVAAALAEDGAGTMTGTVEKITGGNDDHATLWPFIKFNVED